MHSLLAALLCLTSPDASQEDPVGEWLREQAVPLEADGALERFLGDLGDVQVFGLGEATHGQQECFAFKRQLTMHLIREHGFRLVAYESDATRARALDEFVQGRSDDLNAAIGGFGMMIWAVEENRGLLEDLRAWNESAPVEDRVEIIGIDVQDPSGAAEHLHGLLEEPMPELAAEAKAVAEELVAARNAAWQRDTSKIVPAQQRLAAFVTEVQRNSGLLALKTSNDEADEALRCVREIARFPLAMADPGMRDRGMGHSLLDALAARRDGTKAVLWGHNGHITKGPLRWMGTDETGAGGYLRAALGDGYYALGVAFGSGGFQALSQNSEGRWMFRGYEHGAPPEDTLGHRLLEAELPTGLIDFRKSPDEGVVREWLTAACAIRSWGGYGVPDDPDAEETRGMGLAWTLLAEDYDGLLFLERTTRARPIDGSRVWR